MGDTIVNVQFGIANPEDIRKRSVVEVTTEKTYQSGQPVPNGVFDARFGVIENGRECPTCKQTNQFCVGHFGHITLARPVYLYQFFDTVEALCNMICLSCSEPIATIKESGLTGGALFKKTRETVVQEQNRRIVKDKKEGITELTCQNCNSVTFKRVTKDTQRVASLVGTPWKEGADSIPLQPELILRAFQRMTDDSCRAIGLNPAYVRPEWMICTVLAVPPLTVRPSVIMDDHQRMEDDLTHQLICIVRANERLRERIEKGDNADMIDKYTALLQYQVATYVDNDIKGFAPAAQRSGRPLRTLKSRFGSKTGRVRGNLMGKRVDFSARTVITPDANIDLDELGVPEEIAVNLTFPETVNRYNRDRLMAAIRNGPDKHPGAKSVYSKHDRNTFSLRYVNPDAMELRDGDIVHRHLIDGDIVLFNRQPSLHKASMEAHRVKVLPGSTFRLNVSATRPYNADFDGDEMNMHVPQSIASATELRFLASVLRNIISPRTSSPIIQLFQDTMTGAYRITHFDEKKQEYSVRVPEHIAMNILSKIRRPFGRKNRPWTGPELISAAFPPINYKGGGIVIESGQLVSGVLKKGAAGGLLHTVYNDLGPERCGKLINDIQSIVTRFNLYTGFSVGTADLIASPEMLSFVHDQIREGRERVSRILSAMHSGSFLNDMGVSDGEKLELDISSALKSVESNISTNVVKNLSKSNSIVQMVDSGSKGGPINITQMVAALGQQLPEGKRIQFTLQDRSLPHFARYDDGAEARGFIEHSFVDGLMPAEFFFHAMAGREGLIDTAVKTSDTGYIQRRLMKTMEDLHVKYDRTVRNATGSIVQFTYGDDGIDTVSVENQECKLLLMSTEDIYSEYALSAADVNPFMASEVEDPIPDLVDQLLTDRTMLFRDVFRHRKEDMVQAPVNLKRLVERYRNPYNTKTDLTPDYVVRRLNDLAMEFPENKVFHVLLRYYLAPRKAILVHRLTKKLFDELLRDIGFRYIKAQVHPGEMVGALAAQSIGEPTTQLTLNTFHSAGTAKANATSGVPRIEELLSASSRPKRPSNVVYLQSDRQSNGNAAVALMKQIQQTTLRDITRKVKIIYDPTNQAKPALEEDREILEAYRKFDTSAMDCASPWILRLELDELEMAQRSVIDLNEIQTKILNNSMVKSILQCNFGDRPAPGKPYNMVMRIVFSDKDIVNPTQLRMLEDKILNTRLTGVDGIGRVHLRVTKAEVIPDETVGGYKPVEQYVLDVEGTNLYELMVFEGVDGTRTFSNDIHEVLDVFGIETARQALYEEINEVFSTERVNYHHLSMLVDTMTFEGRIVPVNRFGMNKSEIGVLAKSSFETTTTVMFNAATWAERDDMRGVSANIMFGQKPPCGTGFVDIFVDETKLPEGEEEPEEAEEEDALQHVDRRLEKLKASECRLEDILMDW